MQKIGGLFRFKAKIEESPSIRIETQQTHGGACAEKPTQDLVLSFQKTPTDWTKNAQDFSALLEGVKGAPCSIQGTRLGKESFELRLSYLQEKPIQYLPMKMGDLFLVDHWFALPRSKKEKPKKSKKTESLFDNADQPQNEITTSVTRDEMNWKDILGVSGSAIDINSPELNKFRAYEKEKDLGQSAEVLERRSLEAPTLDFPIFLFPIYIDKKDFKPKTFSRVGTRDQKTFADAMNYIKILIERKDWIRAQQSYQITKKSKVGYLMTEDDPYIVTVEGFLALMVGDELKREDQIKYGLDVWAKGLRRVMRKGVEDEEYLLYCFEEYIRRTAERKSYFQLAEFLVWAEKFTWAPEISERLEFLKGEVYFSMKIFDEAQELYKNFVSSREGSLSKKVYDKEYVAASLFRQGDILSGQKKWKEALSSYSSAMQRLPGSGKFLFEGSWYPKEISKYPEVLLNRAQAYYFLGMESSALRDYRAFIFTSGNHKLAPMAMFKIAELLERVGGEKEKIIGTLSECSFKRDNTIGARLCAAKKAAIELMDIPEKQMGRKLNTVERIFTSSTKVDDHDLFKDEDLTVYGRLLWAKAFLDRGYPFQVMEALESNIKVESNSYLSAWNYEYYVTAVSGHLRSLNDRKKYKEVAELYERKKRNSLWSSTRPELLWQIARSFSEQELWDEALQAWKQAEKLKKLIDRKAPRPFDVSIDEWYALAVNVGTKLAAQDKLTYGEVEGFLSNIDRKSESFLRLGIPLYLAQDKNNKAIENWKTLQEKYSLNWNDIFQWQKLLLELNKSKERIEVLEASAGVWMSGDKKEDRPPVDVLLALADARESQLKYEKAMLIYDQLLSWTTKIDFSKAMVMYQKAKLLKKMGNNDLANKSFTEVIQNEPDSLWAKLSKSENQ